MRIDGPTLLISSAVAAAVSTAVMRATRKIAQRRRGTEDLLMLRIGTALVLFGVLLICFALQRMIVPPL